MFVTNRFKTAAVAVGLTFALSPSPAHAQDAQPDKPGLTAKSNNGISIESNGGEDVLQFGGLIQMDGRFDVSDPTTTVVNGFLLRRVRPILQGRFAKYFEFRLMPDFANSTVVLYDAYFDTTFSNNFRIRVGKDKTSVGLEQLYSDYAVLFPERSLVTDLVPNRDVGIQAQGTLGKGLLSYNGAIFNGAPDGAIADVDTNNGKDLAGRLTLKPFSTTSIGPLRGLGVAVGGTSGQETGALPSFKSTAQQTFFSYASSATANGHRNRVSPSAFYYYKSIGAFAEYARTTQAVKGASTTADITNTAWEVTGSFVVTGEAATERGVIPSRKFDPGQGYWGALQLIARYSRLTVDPLAFTDNFAAANASRVATATGIGASWYANGYVKYVLTFTRTGFDDNPNAARRPENAIVFRLQFNLQPTL